MPTAGSEPVGHRGRPGRQPLVHRSCTATGSAGSRRPASSPSSRSPRPAAARAASRPARTATSGSPKTTANQIGRITTAGVITEFPIPTAGSGPAGIAAGPDGNLWFTEVDRQPDRPDHHRPASSPSSRSPRPAARPSASRPARTATSGSPKPTATRSAGSPRPQRRRSPWPSTPIPSTGGNSNANGVLEPGETVQVDPSWKNTLTDPADASPEPPPTSPVPPGLPTRSTTARRTTARSSAGATGDCDSRPVTVT